MKIKVCGMRDPVNIDQAEKAGVDMMGFIFYKDSSRYVGKRTQIKIGNALPVGVFVNENPEVILRVADRWNIEIVQLHGDEAPEECSYLRNKGKKVVKAFSVGEEFNFETLEPFLGVVDFILFDTKGANYGGNGEVFNWKMLKDYKYDVPFWLSGGIEPGMADEIRSLDYPMLYAVDVNSGFEDSPGMKNIEKLKIFVNEIQRR